MVLTDSLPHLATPYKARDADRMRLTINPAKTFKTLADRAAMETNPILRRNVETLLQHQRCELGSRNVNLEGVMSTLSPKPTYHIYCASHKNGDPIADATIDGADAVRALYHYHLQSETFSLVEFDVIHLVVDAFCIAASGIFKMGHRGTELRKIGYDVDDPDAFYLYLAQHAEFYPFDENGLMIGEDIYFPAIGFQGIEKRKITRDPSGIGGFVDVSEA